MRVWPAVPSLGGAGLRGESGAETRGGSPLPSPEGTDFRGGGTSARFCEVPRLLLGDPWSIFGEPAICQELAEGIPGGPEVLLCLGI